MTQSNNKKSGCFSGIARLLLCKGSLQTHPTDQNTEPNTTPIEPDRVNKDTKIEMIVNFEVDTPDSTNTTTTTTNPGVVARLMGLDSLPKTNWVLKGARARPDLVTRSRSVNFMDYILEFDLAQAEDQEEQHRTVRTSVSFREVPTLLNQENNNNNNNNDIFVLYLEQNDKKTGSKLSKSEMGLEEIVKQKNEEKILIKKEKNDQSLNDESRKVNTKQFSRFGSCKKTKVSSPRNKKERISTSKVKSPEKPMNQHEAFVESKFMKKFKNQQAIKEVQSECSSEDSSPFSVLDLDDYIPFQDDMSFPDKNYSPKPTNFDYSSIAHSTRLSIDLEPKELKKNDYLQKSKDSKYYVEVVKKLCRLTEEDIKETKWTTKDDLDYESVEDICVELGQQILNVLVKQVVEELEGFHLKSFIDGKVF